MKILNQITRCLVFACCVHSLGYSATVAEAALKPLQGPQRILPEYKEEALALDVDSLFEKKYSRSETLYQPRLDSKALSIALNDTSDRISKEFKVPAALRKSVTFWMRVYTEFSSRQLIIFDKNHPELIYDILDFNALHASAKNAMNYELNRERVIKSEIRKYKKAFERIQKQKLTLKNKKLNETEIKILTKIESSDHKHSMKDWSKALRSQTGQKDQVIKGLLAAEIFLPKMEELFKELNVPKELTRLPLVESSFNPEAYSKAGAVGVWQFMPKVGKEFMRVDQANQIDERYSPLKSTVAAARLLIRNANITGNWPLAITAYNHGHRGIKKMSPQVRATAIDGSLFQMCSNKSGKMQKKHLGYASQNYFAGFLAILHAEAYKELFFGEIEMPKAPSITFHRLTNSQSARDLSKKFGITIEQFRLFNPDIRNTKKNLPKGFYYALPGEEDTVDELISAITLKPKRKRASL